MRAIKVLKDALHSALVRLAGPRGVSNRILVRDVNIDHTALVQNASQVLLAQSRIRVTYLLQMERHRAFGI